MRGEEACSRTRLAEGTQASELHNQGLSISRARLPHAHNTHSVVSPTGQTLPGSEHWMRFLHREQEKNSTLGSMCVSVSRCVYMEDA